MRILPIILTFMTLLPHFSFQNIQMSIPLYATSNLEDLAITFINLLKEEKFEDVVKLFNWEMAKALPPQKLETVWNQLISNVRELKEIVGTRIAEEGGYRAIYVTCEFAKTKLDIKVVFDGEAKIAGLWFLAKESDGVHGIYIAALIATVISMLLWGGLVYWLSGSKRVYFALMLMNLPLSAIVNLYIKKPMYETLTSLLKVPPILDITSPWWFLLLIHFLPPISEEAIKLSPLIAGRVRNIVNKSSALWMGMAFGMGFGIGEIWYLAWRISMMPEYAEYPFYYFGGFIGERIIAVFIHGVMTAIAVIRFMNGRGGLLVGYIWAVLFHAFANVGAMLYQIKVWDATIAMSYTIIVIIITMCLFEYLRKRELKYKKPKETVLFSRNSINEKS